jgi:hypothetical protein
LDYETVKHAMQETSLQMLRSLPENELVHRYDLITVRRSARTIAHLTERRAHARASWHAGVQFV